MILSEQYIWSHNRADEKKVKSCLISDFFSTLFTLFHITVSAEQDRLFLPFFIKGMVPLHILINWHLSISAFGNLNVTRIR